jgi:hypothetical protein
MISEFSGHNKHNDHPAFSPTRTAAPTCPDDATTAPTGAPYDPVTSAIVDHLLCIREHQAALSAHLGTIDIALGLLFARVEERAS